jgi:hypothetical protein
MAGILKKAAQMSEAEKKRINLGMLREASNLEMMDQGGLCE